MARGRRGGRGRGWTPEDVDGLPHVPPSTPAGVIRPEVQAQIDAANARLTGKNPKGLENARRGRSAKRVGDALEMQVEAINEVYRASGWADVRWVATPVVQVSRPNRSGVFSARRVGPQGVDFRGAIKGGRAVCFDVKGTAEAKLDLLQHRHPTIRESQRAELNAAEAMDSIAALLVKVRDGWWWVTWSQWRAAEERAAKDKVRRLGPAEFDAVGAREVSPWSGPGGASGAPDWLFGSGLMEMAAPW